MIRKYEANFPLKTIIKSLFIKENYKEKLEKLFEKYYKRKVLLCSSGSSAIYIALKDIEKRFGTGFVITSNYSCKSIPRAIIKAGFKPLFVDIDKKLSFNLFQLNRAILENKKSIKAILAWHPEGFVFDKQILEISKRNKISLIEDCASSFANIKGKQVGFSGDYSAFSFRTGKLIHGGGGILLSKENLNFNLSKKNRILILSGILDLLFRKVINWGKPKAIIDHFLDFPGMFRVSNTEAYLVYLQIKHLSHIKKKRKEHYDYILKKVKLTNFLELNTKEVNPCPTSLILLEEKRDKFIKFMKKRGIEITKDHSHINSEVFEEKTYGKDQTKEIATKICHIPVHENLTKKELNKIVTALQEWNLKKN